MGTSALLKRILKKWAGSLILRRFSVIRDAVRWACRRHAGMDALRTNDGETVTFRELDRRVRSLANGFLEQGIAPGQAVAFLLPNTPEFVEVRLACHEAGIIAVPLAPDLPADTITDVLSRTDARLFIFDPRLHSGNPPDSPGIRTVEAAPKQPDPLTGLRSRNTSLAPVSIRPSDTATINFTSGTTGAPKGVISTHAGWTAGLRMMVQTSRMTPSAGEGMLHVIPLATAGWGAILPCLLAGIPSFLKEQFDPAEVLEYISRGEVSRIFVTPSQLIDILDHPAAARADYSSLRAVICGTAPLASSKAGEALDRMGPVLFQGYGLAEVLPPVAMLGPEDHDSAHPFRAGRVAPGVDCRIGDTDGRDIEHPSWGEILLAGPTRSPGYWGDPERTDKTSRGEYFRTGDLGYHDKDGYLNVVGRINEMIPGCRLHPREIEEAAHRHEAVKECALVVRYGRPLLVYSIRRGRDVAREDFAQFLANTVNVNDMPHCLTKLPGDLPRTGAGKLSRGRIGDMKFGDITGI